MSMIWNYIIYGFLILVAVAILPLRIMARRRTLKELGALRSELQLNAEQLLTIMQASAARTREEKETSSTDDKASHALLPYKSGSISLEKWWSPDDRALHVLLSYRLERPRFVLSAGKTGYLSERYASSLKHHQPLIFVLEIEEEDAWPIVRTSRQTFEKSGSYRRLLATT